MIRILTLIFLMTAVSSVGVWFAKNSGEIEIVWLGWEVSTSLSLFFLFIFILLSALFLSLLFLYKLFSFPIKMKKRYENFKIKKAKLALEDGLLACAYGDKNKILKNYKIFNNRLKETPLPLLLKLQASLIKGNEVECFNTYKKMLEYGSSRPIAINGLISFASKNNDTELFSNMLNSASNYKVSLEAFLTEAFNFCLKSQDWIILKEYVNKESRHKLKKIKSFLNILDYQLATQYYKKGEVKEAKEALGDIFLSKNFFPPSVELYLKLNTDKTERKLKKILKAYWSHFPHYSIINCVLNNFKSHDILKKVKLLIELLEGKNDLYLKYMLLGEIKVKAKIWGDAKNDLYKSIQLYPNRKAYYLLVHIEEQTTCNKEKIKNWLSLAQNCKEEVWRCKSCMHIHKKWSISCDNCNSFLTLINDELQNFSKKQPDLLLSGNYLKVV